MRSIFGCRCRYSIAVLVGVVFALLASGCMWGVVRDAQTGEPLSGAKVTYRDSYGQTASTTTDANGMFGFGAPVSAAPAMGSVTFTIEAPAYQTLAEARTVAYDDNPGATLDNLSSFWEAQAFSLARGAGEYHNAYVGFSITFPVSWDIQESSDKLSVEAMAPIASGPAICDVTTGPYPEGVALGTFVDDMLSSVKNNPYVTKFREYKRTAVKVNDVPAVRVNYSFTVKIASGDFKMEGSYEELTYELSKGYTEYSIDCFSTPDDFAAFEATFDKIAKSFRLD